MNSVPTAQVILGIDIGDGTGENAFLEFENGRRSTQRSNVAEWYKSHKQHIVLSTLDNSELIKFTHSFNLHETQDQALFVFEILDPNNTFEINFFNRFFKGAENYSEVIDNILWDAKYRYVDKKFSDLSVSLTEAGESLGREDLDSFSKNLGAGLGNVAREPYTKPLFITFGIGPDMNLWSPVQKAQLVTLEYNLTAEGVKKYIIKCVANTGLLALGELQSVEQYVKGTERTEYRASYPFIYSKKQEEWRVNSPIQVVIKLLTKLLKQVLKEPPFLLFQDLEKVLMGRWSKAVINYFRQTTEVLYHEKLIKDTHFANDHFDTDQLAIKVARMVAPVEGAKLRTLEQGGTLLGLGAEAAVGRKEDLEALGFIVDSAGPDLNTDELDSMFNEYLEMRASHGLPLPPTLTTETIEKNRVWFGTWPGSYSAMGGGVVKFIIPAQGDLPKLAFKTKSHRSQLEAWTQLSGGRLPGYISGFLTAHPTGDASPRSVWDTSRRGGAHIAQPRNPPGTYAELKERAAAHFNKNYVNLNYVSIDKTKLYAIYKAAGKEFFEDLGFTLVERTRWADTMMKETHLYGPAVTKDTFERNSNVGVPLDVEIKKDNSKEVSNALGEFLSNMDLKPQDEPLILGFSELSLLNKFRNTPALIDAGFDATGDELQQMKTIIIATSVRIVSSIINGTELDELKDNKLYTELLKLFKGFKKAEPSLAIKDAPAFSPLFANPDLETTQLPGQTNGVPNYLSVFGNLGKLGRQEPFRTNEEFNQALAEERIPVFNYGFKNSNVISFNFNLRPWYAYFLDVIPTTIMTGLISAALTKEPVLKTVLSFYNNIKGDPNVAIQKAIAKFWKENVADPLTTIKLGSGLIKALTRTGVVPGTKFLQKHKKGIAQIAKTAASINAVRSLGNLAMGDVKDLPSFKKVVTAYLRLALSSPSLTQRLIVNPEMQSTSLQKLLTMRQKLATRVFTGTLTTVPIFSIISPARTISSKALLYFVEPEFMMSPVEKNSTLRSTWLSGEYYIVGYKVEFSGSEITTEFDVVKNPDKAQGLTF